MNIRKEILAWGCGLLIAAGTAGSAIAGEATASEDNDLARLKETVDHLTDIAGKTHLNADHVPGMVTVLYGSDLLDRGIRTAGEALNLVPGLTLSLSSQIYWKSAARGISGPLADGHITLLLNGTSLTTAFGIDLVPSLPIEQVERIEIVRGPASSIHGEQSVTAVVNIVTRETGNRVFGSVGSYTAYLGGGILTASDPVKEFSITMNVSAARSDGADAQIGLAGIDSSNDPTVGETDFMDERGGAGENDRSSRTGLLSLSWRKTAMNAVLLEQDRADWYRTRQASLSAHQEIFLTSSLSAEADVSFLLRTFNSKLEDISFYSDSESLIYQFNYNEKRLAAGAALTWDTSQRYRTLLGCRLSRTDLSGVVRVSFPGERLEDEDRRIDTFRFEEEWRPTERITVTGSGRFEHYSDGGDHFAPSMASVFRLSASQSVRQHLLKIQYGRSFRPPTFLESQGYGGASESLFKTIDTVEIGYVTRKFDETFRSTAFHSEYSGKDAISQRYRVNGFEVEYARPLIPGRLDLDLNASCAGTEDRDTGDPVPGSADFLANIGLTVKPAGWASLLLQLHSVLGRNEEPDGYPLDDYHLLDLTACLHPSEFQDLTLRLGVKNIFEEDFRTLSEDTAGDGSDEPGRFWWLGLSYDF